MRTIILACSLLVGCSPQFDQTRWREADTEGRARANMLPSFLEKHSLKGMSRQEVVALLGEPTTTAKWRGADMVYVLGSDGSLFAIDHEWLLIKLDQQNRVASFERATD